MNRTLTMLARVTAIGGVTAASHAQTIVLSQNFDSLSLGAYGSLNNYDGLGNPTATIIAPGVGETGQALELAGRGINGGANANFGVNIGNLSLSGNTSANLSDYTLSFDLAIGAADPGGYASDVGTFNSGGSQGASYHPAAPAAGAGYTHFSVNMGTLGNEFGTTALDPTSSPMNVDLQVNAFPAGSSGTPDIFFDNLQITMAQPVPEPGSFALCSLALVAGIVVFRRLQARLHA